MECRIGGLLLEELEHSRAHLVRPSHLRAIAQEGILQVGRHVGRFCDIRLFSRVPRLSATQNVWVLGVCWNGGWHMMLKLSLFIIITVINRPYRCHSPWQCQA